MRERRPKTRWIDMTEVMEIRRFETLKDLKIAKNNRKPLRKWERNQEQQKQSPI